MILRAAIFAVLGLTSFAATFEVGPGLPLETPGQVPWATLEPGDTILIRWRAEPYRDKFVICRQGTADAPITLRGVPGPEGQRPVLSGENAVEAPGLNYWNGNRGLIKVGGASIPPDTMPRFIVIENLELRSARPPYQFVDRAGNRQTYSANAAAIYVEKAQNLTIRNCILTDSGNGLFSGTAAAPNISRDIIIDSNYIHSNGNEGSAFEHNVYTEALGITFQFNQLGPLRAGSSGNNLKDRSAGLIVRYNWIEGGNRQLDLVETGSPTLQEDERYRTTFVYGNILVEHNGPGNNQLIHYGGDSGNLARYRKGTLYLYHNTLISTRLDATTLIRLSSNEEQAIVRNNLLYLPPGSGPLALVDAAGILDFSYNWLQPGYRITRNTLSGTVLDSANLLGDDPGFANLGERNLRPTAASPVVDAAGPLPDVIYPDREVLAQYYLHQAAELRNTVNAPDIGAYEFMPPVQ
ncbi:MAG: hypothetical protein JNN08_22705 [Bryobacterales bacterium]|nr:hypothetical protein [Bryobacterales bacterium]